MYRIVVTLTVANPATDDVAVALESSEFCVNHVDAYATAEAPGCVGNGDDDRVCRHCTGNGETIGVWTTIRPHGEINEQFVCE